MSIKSNLIQFLYAKIAKPLFFKIDPETIHDFLSSSGETLGKFALTRAITSSMFKYKSPMLEQSVCGITFKNPVGLSEGFDKDAKLTQILSHVGFGFMQIGSVTDKAYEGNPKPRLIRLPKSKGIVVNYGLKNNGAQYVINKLKSLWAKKGKVKDFPISVSIAKTNCDATSTEEGGIIDYVECFKKFEKEDVGDIYTINISCPNTFGGEPFTTPEKLDGLLVEIDKLNIKKPIFVKMPISIEDDVFDGLCKVIVAHKLQGVIIGNLDKTRKFVVDELDPKQPGGISGKPTWERSNELISRTFLNFGEDLIIVGVGGIFSPEDAYEKIKRGATLIQLITGMIYQGPQLIGAINEGLVKFLKQDGYSNISEAVGKGN